MTRPKKKKRVKHWVLKQSSRVFGRLWFRDMVDIGPRATDKKSEAERFRTRREALQSPAYSHWSSIYEPEAVR